MQLKRIVYATDLSDRERAALAWATMLARVEQGELLICHVSQLEAQPVGELVEDPVTPPPPDEMRRLQECLPTEPEVASQHHLLYAKTPHEADEIVRFAEEQGADMIVVGTHGRRGLGHLVMGSVAEKVVRHATCPVLAVPCSSSTATPKEENE